MTASAYLHLTMCEVSLCMPPSTWHLLSARTIALPLGTTAFGHDPEKPPLGNRKLDQQQAEDEDCGSQKTPPNATLLSGTPS
jgi:hypothetical protein